MRNSMIIAMILVAGTVAFAAEPVTFYVNDEMKRDVVSFTSKAPLETVVGTTGEITGFVRIDPENINNAPEARFEVDLASLKTGIGLRDRHMKEQYLETDTYPKAVFVLSGIREASATALEDYRPIDLILEGDFTVHGVTKKTEITIKATFLKESEETGAKLPGDLLHIEGKFDVLLSDHDIKRPQFVILKLDDLQKINLDLFASTESPPVTTAVRQ